MKNINKKIHQLTLKFKINKSYLKYLVPLAFVLLLLFVFLGSRIVPAMLAGNVYNIGDLSGNIDNIKAGDIINYEINGYSKWRILSVDKENGTVEVTSDSNVYDLTIEPNHNIDYYNELFQTEADKFNDGRYVANTRTIAKSDSLMFDTKGEYWLANVNENSLMTNKTGGQDSSQIPFRKPYDSVYANLGIEVYIPYNSPVPPNTDRYKLKYDFQIYGVDGWYYDGYSATWKDNRSMYYLRFVAENPFELPIDHYVDAQEVDTIAKNYLNNLNKEEALNTILNGDFQYLSDVSDVSISFSSPVTNMSFDFNGKERVPFYRYYNSGNCLEKKYHLECRNSIGYLNPNGYVDEVKYKYLPKTLTFGYRPVLTLKINEGIDGKDKSQVLHVGDHVKYEANGYRNWKVLSVNEEAGTVDIISGGIVKNLSLYGMDDYNNYEEILQNEVDAYRNGDDVINARAISPSDVDLLIAMKDDVESMYWFNDKIIDRFRPKTKNLQTSSNLTEADTVSYGVGVLWTNVGDYYVNNGISSATGISKYWVKFFSESDYRYGISDFHYYLGGTGDLSFVAGLRPIITLKCDSVKKISSVQARKLDKSSKDYDKYYTNEQLSNNFKDLTSGLLFMANGEGFDSDSVSKNDASSTNYRKVDVDLGETTSVVHIAVLLSILSGLLIVGSASFLAIYKYKFVNKN